MGSLRRIVVATDFGDAADTALAHGRALARAFKADLDVLHALEDTFLHAAFFDPQAIERAASDQIERRLTREDRRRLGARAVLKTGAPADVIIQHARTSGAGLIILGLRRAGADGVARGGVGEQVVRGAPCPVLSVHHQEVPMIALKNVLVATDFDEASDAALAYGRALAGAFGATLHVLHVVQNVFLASYGSEFYVPADPNVQNELNESARLQLDHLLLDSDGSGPATRKELRVSNSPAQSIVDYARDTGIDLIVMGTHGRKAVAHLLLGSVAEKVVRTAACPVLTVHHPEHEFVVPDTLVAVSHAS